MNTTHPLTATDLIGRTLVHVRDDFKNLVDAPVWSLDDKGLDARMADALAVRAEADELVARLAGEMEARGHAKRLGGSSTHAHLVGTHRLSNGEARRVTQAARQLHGTPTLTDPVRRAQANGQVSQEQATVIAATINQISPDHPVGAVEHAQRDLIRYAGELPYADLQRVANHVFEVVDPDRADELLEQKLQADEKANYSAVELRLRVKADGSSDGWFKN